MPHTHQTARPPLRNALPAIILCVLYLGAAIPLIAGGHMRGRGAGDHIKFHMPVIRAFADQMPSPDLSDYDSATTPGYHLLMATASLAVGTTDLSLQTVNTLITCALLALLATACARRAGPATATLVCLPFLASLYVFTSGVWLLPDNLGWLGVLVVLLLALRDRFEARTLLIAGAALVMLVFVRQIHIWTAAALWTAAYVCPPRRRPRIHGNAGATSAPALLDLLADIPARLRGTLEMGIVTIPAFLLLVIFLSIWGGLIPPQFQAKYHGFSPATPAFVLALLAIYSCFFGADLWAPLVDLWRRHRPVLIGAIAIGLLCALLPATTYSEPDGRYSGIWNIVRKIPTIGGRTSPLFVALAPLGAAALCAWAHALPRRMTWVILASLGAFIAAQSASPMLWQRYNEPLLLMVVAIMASSVREPVPTPDILRGIVPLWRRAGPVCLALLLAANTTINLARATPPVPREAPADASASARHRYHPGPHDTHRIGESENGPTA
jgi:hypothetical protein